MMGWIILMVGALVVLSNEAKAFQAQKRTEVLFFEGEDTYIERIIFDDVTNTTEYDVPKHLDREATNFLVDHNARITVMRMETGVCYAMKTIYGDSNANVREAVRQIDGIIEKADKVEEHTYAPISRLNPSDVSPKVRTFCQDRPIILVKETTLSELEESMRAKISRRVRRNSNVDVADDANSFVFCNDYDNQRNNSDRTIHERNNDRNVTVYVYTSECPNNQRFLPVCRLQTKNCVYVTKCNTPLRQPDSWVCRPEIDHRYNRLLCCDLACRDIENSVNR